MPPRLNPAATCGLGRPLRAISASTLPEEERSVIHLRFGTGDEGEHSIEQTARRLGVPVREARAAEQRALAKLSQLPGLEALRAAA